MRFSIASLYGWISAYLDKNILNGFVWSFFGRGLQAFFGILTVSFIAHHTIPETYGGIMLIYKLLSFSAIICLFGFKEYLVKIVAEKNARQESCKSDAIFGICLLLSSVFAVLLGFLGTSFFGDNFLVIIFKSKEILTVAPLLTLVLIPFIFQSLFYSYFRGLKLFSKAVIFNGSLSGLVLYLALIVSVMWNVSIDIHSIVILLLIVYSFVALIAIGLTGPRIRRIFKFQFSEIFSVLKVASAFYLLTLISEYCSAIYSFYLGAVSGAEDVAILVSLQKLAVFISAPLTMLYFGLGPVVSESSARGRLFDVTVKLKRSLRIIFCGSISLFCIYLVFGDSILEIIFGSFFSHYYPYLIILGAAHVINVATGPWGGVLLMAGRQKLFLYIMLGNAILYNLIFFYPVCLKNIEGVVYSLFIFPVLINVFGCIICRKIVGIRTDIF